MRSVSESSHRQINILVFHERHPNVNSENAQKSKPTGCRQMRAEYSLPLIQISPAMVEYRHAAAD
jgi:hypothetical protein